MFFLQKSYLSFFIFELISIGVYVIFSIVLSIIILLLSYSASTSNPDLEKVSTYECGFDPYEDARNAFDIRFYLVAILFIVFDLEALYFYPWCVSASFLTDNGIFSMLDFVLELVVGFLYAWRVGALEWK